MESFKDFDKQDPVFVEKIIPFLEGLYKYYFRCEVSGWENVPPDNKKPALYVGNHNGLLTFEFFMMFYAWWVRFGTSRKAFGLAHNMAVKNPLFSWLCTKMGAIPASPKIGREALSDGCSLLVYPGGEKEAFRPYKERKEIDFFQRKGFIRLALSSGVPIVPIVSTGAHETYVILHRGEEIAEKLGLKEKYRLHGVPLTYRSLFFLWCVATGMLTFFPLLLAPAAFASIWVPMPAKMNFRILPPIDVVSMVDPRKSEEENLQRIYDHVLGEMRKAHLEEYKKRKFPVVG